MRMTTFSLPDLGEGLQEAEIVAWHVAEGDAVKTDDLLVSVETAKAVVEVPSPYTGVIEKLYASAGDIVATGAPLVDFSEESSADAAPQTVTAESGEVAPTVVGNVPTGGELLQETAVAGGSRRQKKGRIKATPSVRTQAKRMGIDLADISPTRKLRSERKSSGAIAFRWTQGDSGTIRSIARTTSCDGAKHEQIPRRSCAVHAVRRCRCS
jgi:pyruvate dehydrogenase E2 component (dihydrolipoamide acetyltransferase)